MLKQNRPIITEVKLDSWHSLGYTGKGVTLVILDDNSGGIESMNDYFSTPLGHNGKFGHATAVAQAAHAAAPDMKIIALDGQIGYGKSLDWLRENADSIDLINISLAGINGVITPKFVPLEDLGIPVIVSSGNDGRENKISYPANYDFTIGIGSWDWDDDEVYKYSNGGDDLDAVSPSNIYVENGFGNIVNKIGTSFSSPFCAGMLACFIQWRNERKLPRLKPEEARSFIHDNCVDVLVEGFDNKSGNGLFVMPKLSAMDKYLVPIKEEEPNIEEEVIKHMEQYFKDVPKDFWAFDAIQKLKDRGIAGGRADGTFGPNDVVTRAQFAVMINNAIDYAVKEAKK